MIKLTEVTELLGQKEPEYTPIYVPAGVVVRVWSGKTIVDYDGQSHTVVESPEEVARKVLGYQRLMEEYKALCVVSTEKSNDLQYVHDLVTHKMLSLAGLEEQKHESHNHTPAVGFTDRPWV